MSNTTAPVPRRKRVTERREIARSTALNKTEAEIIDAAAGRAGVSVSTFLRTAALRASEENDDA